MSLTIRPMSEMDLSTAMSIVATVEPEDLDAAGPAIREAIDDSLVLESDEGVIGFGGWSPDEETDRTGWLGWTLIRPDVASAAAWDELLEAIIELAREAEVRKLFAMESVSPPVRGAAAHAAFMDALARKGFAEEDRQVDFYARGLDAVFLGCRLEPPGPDHPEAAEVDESAIRITGAEESEESDGTYVLEWEVVTRRGSDAGDLDAWANRVARKGGHLAVISIPSTMLAARDILLEAGFEDTGLLTDFHADGIHQVHHARHVR